MHAMTLKRGENAAAGRPEIGGEPPGIDSKPLALPGFNFCIEGGNVLVAPVIGEMFKAKSIEHLRPLFRPTLFGVKRDDAPGNEIGWGKQAEVSGGTHRGSDVAAGDEASATKRDQEQSDCP